MAKKIYIKDESFDPIFKEVSKGFYLKTKFLPTFLFLGGLFVFFTQVLLPLVVFTTQDETTEDINNKTVVGRAAGFYNFAFTELESPKAEYIPRKNSDNNVIGMNITNVPEYFYISIPKLKIKDAKVETNAKTLSPDTALGHYPGTSLPGEVGNAFIFGHSVLPWFYNPNNYKTIFSTLDDLQPGDEFTVTYNNKELTYRVETKEERLPDEVNPLAEIKPKYLNESTMVLMTCSPAGTKLKRLLVNAVLVKS